MASTGTDFRLSELPKAAVRQLQLLGHGQLQPRRQLSDLRCHLGRRGPLLQLAAKRPAHRTRGAGHDGDRGVHAQRRITQSALMAITRNAGAISFLGKRMVQGGVLQGRRDQCRLLDLPHAEQHRAEQHAFRRPARTTPTINEQPPGYTEPTNHLTPVGAFRHLLGPTARMTWAAMFRSGTRALPATRASWRARRQLGTGNCDYLRLLLPRRFNSMIRQRGDYWVSAWLCVPEPGSITLVVAGGLCLLAYAWRRRRV